MVVFDDGRLLQLLSPATSQWVIGILPSIGKRPVASMCLIDHLRMVARRRCSKCYNCPIPVRQYAMAPMPNCVPALDIPPVKLLRKQSGLEALTCTPSKDQPPVGAFNNTRVGVRVIACKSVCCQSNVVVSCCKAVVCRYIPVSFGILILNRDARFGYR